MKVFIPVFEDKTENYIKACDFMGINYVVSDKSCDAILCEASPHWTKRR